MRRFYVVSTVMGNDEKCLLLRVGFRFSAVDLPVQKFCAGSVLKIANGHVGELFHRGSSRIEGMAGSHLEGLKGEKGVSPRK